VKFDSAVRVDDAITLGMPPYRRRHSATTSERRVCRRGFRCANGRWSDILL